MQAFNGSKKTITILTHSGPFHADDVVGYCILQAALRHRGQDFRLLRSRSDDEIAKADIVWDVGAVYEPSSMRFDHHMREQAVRKDGVPYSAAGLLWIEFGHDAVRYWLGGSPSDELVEVIADKIDRDVIYHVDKIDNGIASGSSIDIAALVDDYNLPWHISDADREALETPAFVRASAAIDGFLSLRIEAIHARELARATVLEAAEKASNPYIIELPCGMPWKGAIFDAGLPVVYAISPGKDGLWYVSALPDKRGSMGQRVPLPEAWAGLKGENLEFASDIPGAVFVHRARFIAGAISREVAYKMAEESLRMANVLKLEDAPSEVSPEKTPSRFS